MTAVEVSLRIDKLYVKLINRKWISELNLKDYDKLKEYINKKIDDLKERLKNQTKIRGKKTGKKKKLNTQMLLSIIPRKKVRLEIKNFIFLKFYQNYF